MSIELNKQVHEIEKVTSQDQGGTEINFGNLKKILEEACNVYGKVGEDLKKVIGKDPLNKELLDLQKNILKFGEELKNHTDNVNNNIDTIISSPMKNLAEHLEKDTFIGKLQNCVTEQAEKAKEKLQGIIGENKLLKSAWGVVAAVCEVIKVTVKGVLDSAIAHGKLAASVKDFSAVVSNSLQKNSTNIGRGVC